MNRVHSIWPAAFARLRFGRTASDELCALHLAADARGGPGDAEAGAEGPGVPAGAEGRRHRLPRKTDRADPEAPRYEQHRLLQTAAKRQQRAV